MTTLSIVIPAYNEERFIGTLLQKIRAVDLEPLDIRKEIVVVDDCSADRTSEIVAGFSEVRLWVMEENTRARRFYERYGFTPDGTHHLFRLTAPDGSETAIPEVRYALPLRSDQRPAPTTGVESHSGA